MIKRLDKKALNLSEFNSHEAVYEISEIKSGLRGFIAIHNTNLGAAVGGTRMLAYPNKREALRDVLRLSRAMTFKCALSGIKHGGGKAVIIKDPSRKTPGMLTAYADCLNELGGRFYTGEDVGISEGDVQLMLKTCPYFIGKTGQAGDPSNYASLSTFISMQVAIEDVFHTSNLKGIKVGVKGVGKVGRELVRLLLKSGATVIVCDLRNDALRNLPRNNRLSIVSPEKIISEALDVYSPCALGNEFSLDNVSSLKAKIVCGGANNQLYSPQVGVWFHEHGVLYIPDYVANAGGLIDVADELERGGFNKKRVLKRIERVRQTVKKIIRSSHTKNKPTSEIADELARKIFIK